MTIIETKVDKLFSVVNEQKSISTKDAALALNVTEEYVKHIAKALQKSGLIDLKASAFSLTLVSVKSESKSP